MKATGIVRRIDDLGRVVIPKEIRRTMRIREGDPLEIYTDREGEVIFKKYSPVGEMGSFAAQYAETLYKTCNIAVIIGDRDVVTACAGVSKKEYLDRRLSPEVGKIIESRSVWISERFDISGRSAKDGKFSEIRQDQDGKQENPVISPPVTEGGNENMITLCVAPIISSGDTAGAVCAVCERDELEKTLSGHPAGAIPSLIATAANFLGRQLED